MILAVEERDEQGILGLGINVGLTHFYDFNGHALTHIKYVAHTNNNYRNDSGQSACQDSMMYQVNCICTLGGDAIDLTIWDKNKYYQGTTINTYAKIKEYSLTYNSEKLRLLGIDFYGNRIIASGMEYPSYTREGLYWINLEKEIVRPMAWGWVPAGIRVIGNQVFSTCQDDNYLRCHSISHWSSQWSQCFSRTIPNGGTTAHFRGITDYGNYFLVGNEENHTVDLISVGMSAITCVKQFSVSANMLNASNKMPYGLWRWA
jgi:hypothetical protein